MLILNGVNAPTKNTAFIKDVNMHNFATEVLEASQEKIVLVDFWAPWCGPCKQLTPILEKGISKHQDKIILAKINIDENAELAAQLRIQTIPTVYAFFRGQPIDAFMGNVSEQKLEQFLSKLLELTKVPSSLNLEGALKQAQEAFNKSSYEEAAGLYMQILRQIPEQEKAMAGIAHCYLLLNHADEAKGIFNQIPEDKRKTREATHLSAHLELLHEIASMDLPLGDSKQKSFQSAIDNFENGEIQTSIQQLLEIIRLDINWNNGMAKDTLVKIFSSLGHGHYLTIEGRRKLSAILFS